MARKIKDTKSLRRVRDTSLALDRLEPDEIGKELGADQVGESTSGANPVAFYALREHLVSELVSTGGRPGRRQVTRRRKIPLTEEEWNKLKEVAEVMKTVGVNAAPGQVAGALLRQGIEQLDRERDESVQADTQDDAALDERVDRLMKAAASSGECPPGLRPVARELLRRMVSSSESEGEG